MPFIENKKSSRYFLVFNIKKKKTTLLEFKNLFFKQLMHNIQEKKQLKYKIKILNFIIFEDKLKYKTRHLFFIYFDISLLPFVMEDCLEYVVNNKDEKSLLNFKNLIFLKLEENKCFDSDYVGSCLKNYLPFIAKHPIPKEKLEIIYDSFQDLFYYNQFFPKPPRVKQNKIVFLPNILDSYRPALPPKKQPNYPRYPFLTFEEYPQLYPPYPIKYRIKKSKKH